MSDNSNLDLSTQRVHTTKNPNVYAALLSGAGYRHRDASSQAKRSQRVA